MKNVWKSESFGHGRRLYFKCNLYPDFWNKKTELFLALKRCQSDSF